MYYVVKYKSSVRKGEEKTLFTIHSYLLTNYAGMAELADAYDSGSYERKFLRVQVPFPAPIIKELLFVALLLFMQKNKYALNPTYPCNL